MIAKWFGELVLRRRQNAILIALLCSPIALTNWLSMLVVVIVTLVKGSSEGLMVLIWALLSSIVIGVVFHYWFLLLVSVFGNGILLWLLTIAYRRTRRWEYVISLAVIIGLAFVLILHMSVPDPVSWIWSQDANMARTEGMPLSELTERGKHFIIGINVSSLLLLVLFELIIGVAVVAVVKNNRQGASFRYIRLHYGSVLIWALFAVLAVIGPRIFCSLVMIITLPFFIAGVSLVCDFIARKKLAPHILLMMYLGFFVMLLLLFPIIPFLVVLLAIADSFVNFRQKKWFN